ncbi:MAG TPA: two-component system response regulator [Cyanobacteria bacterium UBA8803]|nr:two-component system response regulator [Cyanobacteria bacterium UBA8803]
MSTVLVVEDNLTQQNILCWVLKQMGLKVIIANDGLEALEKIQNCHPELVILDIVLPHMNGYEVCRRLRSDPKSQTIPVIMCSAKKEEFDRYWGIKQGADAYLTKPYQAREIAATVKRLLNRDKQLLRLPHLKVGGS